MQVSTLLVAICNAAAPCVALLLCDDCGDSRTRDATHNWNVWAAAIHPSHTRISVISISYVLVPHYTAIVAGADMFQSYKAAMAGAGYGVWHNRPAFRIIFCVSFDSEHDKAEAEEERFSSQIYLREVIFNAHTKYRIKMNSQHGAVSEWGT